MTKIDLAGEILKHSDEEVIEFLSEQLQGVVKLYAQYENPSDLVGCATTIGLAYNVLKEMDKRNKKKAGQDGTVVL